MRFFSAAPSTQRTLAQMSHWPTRILRDRKSSGYMLVAETMLTLDTEQAARFYEGARELVEAMPEEFVDLLSLAKLWSHKTGFHRA